MKITKEDSLVMTANKWISIKEKLPPCNEKLKLKYYKNQKILHGICVPGKNYEFTFMIDENKNTFLLLEHISFWMLDTDEVKQLSKIPPLKNIMS